MRIIKYILFELLELITLGSFFYWSLINQNIILSFICFIGYGLILYLDKENTKDDGTGYGGPGQPYGT